MSEVDAQNWSEYLTNVYPEVEKSLENCPERIDISLPLDARDETKEQEFKQKLENDAKKTREKLSTRTKLSIYGYSFKGDILSARSVAYLGSPLALVAPMFHLILAIIPVAYFGGLEYFAYRASERGTYNAIRNLENIGNNVFINYIKQV